MLPSLSPGGRHRHISSLVLVSTGVHILHVEKRPRDTGWKGWIDGWLSISQKPMFPRKGMGVELGCGLQPCRGPGEAHAASAPTACCPNSKYSPVAAFHRRSDRGSDAIFGLGLWSTEIHATLSGSGIRCSIWGSVQI